MELHFGHWHLGRYLRLEVGPFGLYATRFGIEVWHRARRGPHRVYCVYLGGLKTTGKTYLFSYVGGHLEPGQPNPHRRH